MSTEQIVNRTAFGSQYEQDKAALELEQEVPQDKWEPIPIPNEFNLNPAMAGQLTAEAARAPEVGRIELPPNTDFIPIPDEDELAAAAANSLSPEQQIRDLAGTINNLIQNTELEKFKKQVIAAFKHLGLDTRKFFGV